MGKLRIGETGLAMFMWVFWDSGGGYLTQSPASNPCCALCVQIMLSVGYKCGLRGLRSPVPASY